MFQDVVPERPRILRPEPSSPIVPVASKLGRPALRLHLSGVGPKTAAVVMAFSLGMPAMPVDTHIHRVSGRIGLIRKGTSADDAHVVLEKIVEPQDRFNLHMLLITHGRQICKARRPICGECPLADHCPSAGTFN